MASKKQDAQDEGGLIYQNLRKLINIVDELRDVGLQQYINLPRIAVLGT
jgi:vacuolar protein sorting-associated protein 1